MTDPAPKLVTPAAVADPNLVEYNEFGFDANGFNREGYDEHGFNAVGLDAQGYNAEAMRDGLIASQGRSYLSLTTYKEEGRWVGKVGEAEAA